MTGYVRPASLAEAVAARAAHPDWIVLAGGTDLMVEAPQRPVPAGIIDLWAMPELRGIARDGDAIRIGAGTSWLEVMVDPLITVDAPVLAAAAREIGALQIQTRGTIGGNVVTSSPLATARRCWPPTSWWRRSGCPGRRPAPGRAGARSGPGGRSRSAR